MMLLGSTRFATLVTIAVVGLLALPAVGSAHDVGGSSFTRLDVGFDGMSIGSAALPAALPAAGPQSLECNETTGMAGPYQCRNVDLVSMAPLPLGGELPGNDNDMWGWTDPRTGTEYAIVGTTGGTTFVDLSDPEFPVTVGVLPTSAVGTNVLWRDIKVDGNYAFIVSEHQGHGMQVFDLRKLRRAGPGPNVFTADTVYRGRDDTGQPLSNSHNIGINEETDFAYAVGSNTCDALGTTGENGGLHMIDISEPEDPEFAGCARVQNPPSNNYVHDVECVIYRGPDSEHRGDEICFGANEDVVTIYDVTDKDNPEVLSQTTYESAAYTHQGWLTADQEFFIFGDELDEGLTPPGENTRTYILQVLDLENPEDVKTHTHETKAIDHNLYIDDGLIYESNYTAGVRILDFTQQSLENGQLDEVGFFDTFVAGDPATDPNEFAGTWSNYAFFESGIVVATSIEGGTFELFVLRPTGDAVGPGSTGEDPDPGGGGDPGDGDDDDGRGDDDDDEDGRDEDDDDDSDDSDDSDDDRDDGSRDDSDHSDD